MTVMLLITKRLQRLVLNASISGRTTIAASTTQPAAAASRYSGTTAIRNFTTSDHDEQLNPVNIAYHNQENLLNHDEQLKAEMNFDALHDNVRLERYAAETETRDDEHKELKQELGFDKMTNDELADTSTIPGWHLIHSPPRKFPRGTLIGTIVSTKMQKTVNVAVDRYYIVPKIRKRMRYTRKFMAHDEREVGNMGDLVMITPSQRFSKMKHFMLSEIIRPKGQL
jgi:small subunit ribosomal protein S17